MITYIRLDNFKSIRHLDLNLGKLNMLIGRNGSGKSNFLSFFHLLQQGANGRLNTAINTMGGFSQILDGEWRTRYIAFATLWDASFSFAPRTMLQSPHTQVQEVTLMIDKTRLTAAQFFPLQAASNERLELIDGEIVVAATPIPDHQDVILNIASLLKDVSKTNGGKVHIAPLDVVLDDDNIVQPDVVWRAPQSRCQRTDKRLEGVPELVVEALSPSTARYDKSIKFALYERHGVNEYWIVDVANQSLDVWTLKAGQYARQGSYAPGEMFASAVLGGAEVDVTAIFTY